jgi:hypothetical protein
MALSLLPQPKSVKTLVGSFDFREVDTVYISKRATARTKQQAAHLTEELKRHHHLSYDVQVSPNVMDPNGCLLTHHTRGGVFVKTTLEQPQAYELLAAGHTLAVSAADDGGFACATRTIVQLLQEGTRIAAMKIQDWPTVPCRVLHLDLQGLTPNLPSLKEFVERAALHKFNALLVEYGDRFPYECLPQARGPHAFTPETLKEFLGEAAENGLEIIPLVPCLGDLEFVLSRDPYRELAEVPDVPSQICPAHPKAERLVREMLREILAAHPRARFVHLGPGRTGQLGQHPLSKAAAGKLGGPAGLLLQHVARFVRYVRNAGPRVLVSEEPFRGLPLEQLRKLPKDTALVYACFEPNGGQFQADLLPHLDPYRQAGLKLFGASAVRGMDTNSCNVPHFRHRFDNMDWWIEATESNGPFEGHIAWGRARFGFHLTACDPLPVAWPTVLYAAERMWSGPDSSRESFERRLLAGFYGLRPDMAEVALAHYGLAEDHAGDAAIVFGNARQHARRNRDVLEILEALARLEVFSRERQKQTERIAALLPRLETGRADPAQVRLLRSKLPGWQQELEVLRRELARLLLRRFHKEEVDDFLQDRLLIAERFLAYLQNLLKRN